MARLRRIHSDSSMITSTAYHPHTETLELVFCNGGIYEYHQIGEEIYEEFLAAESIGEYFNNHIRLKYPYTKVRD